MKISVDKTVLSKALSTVSRVVESRTTIPILQNVALTASENTLSIKATDLDLEVTLSVPANIEVPGMTTVSGKLLPDIARKMAGDTISFEAKEGTAVVKSGRSKFTLQTLPIGDFPDLTIGEFSHSFEMKAHDLRRMLKRASFAISTEETRYYLNGIYFHVIDEGGAMKLRAVATDGHRLAKIEIDAPIGSGGMPAVIIPRKTVGEVDKVLDGAETVKVSMSENKIQFEVAGALMTSKVIDGQFPDYQRVIPNISNNKVFADKSSLAKAVDRMSTVSSQRGRAVKVSFGDGIAKLHVFNPEMGDASEEVTVDYDSEPIEIGFNAQYLTEIMSNVDADSVEIYLTDAGSPARIHPLGDASTIIVLMPMRV